MQKAELLALPDEQLIESAALSEAEFDALEGKLRLRAAVLNWTGDPLKQPLRSVCAEVRAILRDR